MATQIRRGGLAPRVVTLGALLFALSAHNLHAQVGNNNPTGVSGIFNGEIGDGIDPYTGNIRRSITDISVAGAVGEYPLALVRTANSRTPSTTQVFGEDGGWNHNYNWIMEDSPTGNTSGFQPASYTVDFPDGRVATFRSVTWDTKYRVRGNPNHEGTSAGIRERLAELHTEACNMCAYVILPDGGKIEFAATQHQYGSQFWYTYRFAAIIDPYGLRTTISSTLNGS